MRRIVMMSVLVVALAPASIEAQDVNRLKIKSVSIGSGRDAIASGITGTAVFTPANDAVYGEFTVQPEQAWLTLAKNFGKKVPATVGGSIGYLQGAPWVGPYVLVSVPLVSKVKFSGLYWPALFAWEPSFWKNDGVKNPESLAIGNFGIVSLGTDRVKLSYAMLDFLDEPFNRLPGGSITLPLAEKVDFTANGTWNSTEKVWMFYMGTTWSIR